MSEAHLNEIHGVLLYLEDSRRSAERGAKQLRDMGAEPHLVEALEQTQAELSDLAKRLTQDTFFAVPEAQATL